MRLMTATPCICVLLTSINRRLQNEKATRGPHVVGGNVGTHRSGPLRARTKPCMVVRKVHFADQEAVDQTLLFLCISCGLMDPTSIDRWVKFVEVSALPLGRSLGCRKLGSKVSRRSFSFFRRPPVAFMVCARCCLIILLVILA
jgi:hypothetical protein